MHDDILHRLVRTLDGAVDDAQRLGCSHELAQDLEVAALRLRCLEQRLGRSAAGESAYLAFLRRTVEPVRSNLAASA
jgi:hypothetical protein